MKQFASLLKKEFLLFFKGNSAYFLIFIYLFASLSGTFYFGNYLAAKDSSLYTLFSLQPYILAFIVPIITMRTWSEEYKSNTAELLLTLPISLSKTITAKFCAALIFTFCLSLSLLPFVIYSSFWLNLDWLNIFASYFGLVLLIAFFCAFGCLISSLSNNLSITYALSISLLFSAIMIPQTQLISAYNNFLFAEIGVFEIFYFLSFCLIFLFINRLIIEYRRNTQSNSRFLLIFSIIALIFADSLICWSLSIFDHKFDLTSSRFYTLKKPTKLLIGQIKKPTEINLFISEDYFKRDNSISHYFGQIGRFLNKYQDQSEGMIKFFAHKVPAFSEQENQLIDKGFYYIKNPQGSKNYLGAIIKNNEGNEQVITAFLPQRSGYLEEDIDRALLKTAFPELKKSVGIYFDAEQNLDNFEAAALILENEYNTSLLDNTTYQISKKAAAVILFNPKYLSPVFLYALDQYVINGGNLLIFIDRDTKNQIDRINDQPLSILRILNNWGINLGDISTGRKIVPLQFNGSDYKIVSDSAFEVEFDDKNLNILKLITDKEKTLGIATEGEFHSFFEANPYIDTPLAPLMRPFKSEAKTGRVVVIGDADILDETNWIAANSPDRDIYATISKADNGLFIKALFDYIAGNNIYAFLPKNRPIENSLSISEKIENQIIDKTEKQYRRLQSKSDDLLLQIWQMAEYDKEKMPMLIDLTDVGREFQSAEDEIKHLEYQRTEDYNRTVRYMMLWLILILPLAAAISAMLIFAMFSFIRNKSIKELQR